MAKQTKKASDLKGLNIYQDPKKGTVLYDFITKKGYQLTTSDVGKYSLSQAFLPVAVVLTYGLYSFGNLNMRASIIISIIAYILMRLIYRFKFLNNLPYIENYQLPDNGNIFINASKKYSKLRLIALMVLALALTVLTIIYLLTSNLSGIEYYGVIALVVISILLLVFATITLIIQNKMKK